ncbi:sensor histidine kinase [Butyrivibrio sp. WCD3002]|uniref:sensor histidine kinase n=1 Tax=Butyrivibrio sp. WCD3002 TaxID=1280676 RepID=UPI0009DBA6BF|nr:histidine kinase [Butyrivibrio sp. WCD3002]
MKTYINDPGTQTLIALNMTLIAQLVGVTLAVLLDPYIKKENRFRVFVIEVIIAFLLFEPQFSEDFGDIFYKNNLCFWLTFMTSISYVLRSITLYLFIRLSGNEWGKKFLYGLLAINAAICFTAFFKPWVFAFGEDGSWCRGPLGYVPFITCAILIIVLIIGAYTRYKGHRRAENFVPLIISVFVVVAVLMDLSMNFGPRVSFLNVAMTESTVFFYIWLHLQFVREHEDALKAEQRIRIMMSQIQPHFLFNALSTIQALTETDPDRASKVIEEFATYLRQNIHSLNQDSLISVKKEIEHTRVYSDIEQVRFPSIKIDYDIDDDDFMIPPLTIQPMVENAIRHGVRGNKHGWVAVNTYKDGAFHVISIRDNGTGFDVNEMLEATENGDHIGIRNVRDRIVNMTGGTFTMESVKGEGTSITIKIPE